MWESFDEKKKIKYKYTYCILSKWRRNSWRVGSHKGVLIAHNWCVNSAHFSHHLYLHAPPQLHFVQRGITSNNQTKNNMSTCIQVYLFFFFFFLPTGSWLLHRYETTHTHAHNKNTNTKTAVNPFGIVIYIYECV